MEKRVKRVKSKIHPQTENNKNLPNSSSTSSIGSFSNITKYWIASTNLQMIETLNDYEKNKKYNKEMLIPSTNSLALSFFPKIVNGFQIKI